MAGKLNIKLKDTHVTKHEDSIMAESWIEDAPLEVETSTESNEGKVYNPDWENTQPELTTQSESEPEIVTIPTTKAEPLDLLKSALTLIIAKAEAIDINVDKPKLIGKLKGALEILNQN